MLTYLSRYTHRVVVPCTSAIRALLAFIIGHDTAHNFLLKRRCCRFAQDIGITSDPRITFPYFLKIRASTLKLCALMVPERRRDHSLEGPINFGATRSIRPQQRPSPSNLRRTRRTVVAPPLAISSIGAFRTPAVGACGLGRHAGVRKPSQEQNKTTTDHQRPCAFLGTPFGRRTLMRHRAEAGG